MCGRFTLTSNLDDLQGRFQFDAVDLGYQPSYNIAPTQQVLTVTNDGLSWCAGGWFLSGQRTLRSATG